MCALISMMRRCRRTQDAAGSSSSQRKSRLQAPVSSVHLQTDCGDVAECANGQDTAGEGTFPRRRGAIRAALPAGQRDCAHAFMCRPCITDAAFPPLLARPADHRTGE